MIDRIYTRFRNYPLTKKLTAVIMLASILVVLLSFFLFVATEALSYWRLEREKLTSMADIVGQNSIAAITFGDAKAAEETLSGLRNNPHILAAYIEYTDGSVFAEYLSTTNPGRRLTSVTGTGGGSLQAVKHRPFWAGISMFEVSRPIMLENQMIGRIVIQSDREELISRLGSFSLVSLLILLSAFLFSFFISRRLQHLVSQPILDILQTMRAISREKNIRFGWQSRAKMNWELLPWALTICWTRYKCGMRNWKKNSSFEKGLKNRSASLPIMTA
jgi:hypothetical protein